jgi:exopolyphosphatase/guanosine-5'-triphosphate,3'-diphosphate pyrophosphatase
MRVAAIDVGTNSIHMLVADVLPDGQVQHVEDTRIQVMLGSGGIGEHRITPEAFARGVTAMRQLRAAADSLSVEDIHASATSAVREASNGPAFCKAVKDATDIHVRVISGSDEARLIWLGARAALDFNRGPTLLFDVGGGSTEFILGSGAEPSALCSIHLGHIRLADGYLKAGNLTDSASAALKRHVRRELKPVLQKIPPGSFGNMVGTSGTVRCLARMAHAARTGQVPDHDEGLVLGRKELERLIERIRETPASRLGTLAGMDERRRDSIVAGAVLVREIMKSWGAEQLTTSERSLRDGLLIDWMMHHRPEIDLQKVVHQPRERSLVHTMHRFGVEEKHAQQVAKLSTEIFDRTARLHELAASDRELLRAAALLHDIGHHVAGQGHPRHGQYLLKHIRLYGFTAPEVAILANIVRYHSRGRPKRKHHDFAALPKDAQRKVCVLAGILQIADGLDRSHNQPVHTLRVDTSSGRLRIEALTHDGADLERWETDQRRQLLSDALGLPVDVDVTETPPADGS